MLQEVVQKGTKRDLDELEKNLLYREKGEDFTLKERNEGKIKNESY